MNLFAILVRLAIAAAAADRAPFDIPVSDKCPASRPDASFFPAELVAADERDPIWPTWYARFLRAAGETPLWCGPGAQHESYRFMWIPPTVRMRAPGVRTMVVRVSHAASGDKLVATVLPPPGPNKIAATTVSRVLEPAQWQALTGKLTAPGFWRGARPEHWAMDGAECLFEGRRAGRYHIIMRNASDLRQCQAMGLAFLAAAGLALPP